MHCVLQRAGLVLTSVHQAAALSHTRVDPCWLARTLSFCRTALAPHRAYRALSTSVRFRSHARSVVGGLRHIAQVARHTRPHLTLLSSFARFVLLKGCRAYAALSARATQHTRVCQHHNSRPVSHYLYFVLPREFACFVPNRRSSVYRSNGPYPAAGKSRQPT